jgi:uncharacterized protein
MSFLEQYGPWAIIAGASEGIGAAFAREIAAQGVACLLIALDGPLEDVAAEISASTGVQCVTAKIDLSASDAFARIIDAAGDREIGLYVANAGGDYSGSRYLDNNIENWLGLMRLNIATTMQSCHHFGLQMRKRKRGGVLLVNSGGCYGGGSFLTMYTACKGFLLNFAEGLWAELHSSGVDVLTIILGMTDTPKFRHLMAGKGLAVPDDIASAEAVARAGLQQLAHGPVYHWGAAEDEIGPGGVSAAQRRTRVLQMDEATARMYN